MITTQRVMVCWHARNASRCAAGEKIKQAGKREGGAVNAGGKEEEDSRGKISAEDAGGQAWINNVSMGW